MAEIVEYTFKDGRRSPDYPFDKWADGQTWQVVKGVDFDSSIQSLRMTMYKAASRMGKKVRTAHPSEDVLVFRFYDDPEATTEE